MNAVAEHGTAIQPPTYQPIHPKFDILNCGIDQEVAIGMLKQRKLECKKAKCFFFYFIINVNVFDEGE